MQTLLPPKNRHLQIYSSVVNFSSVMRLWSSVFFLFAILQGEMNFLTNKAGALSSPPAKNRCESKTSCTHKTNEIPGSLQHRQPAAIWRKWSKKHKSKLTTDSVTLPAFSLKATIELLPVTSTGQKIRLERAKLAIVLINWSWETKQLDMKCQNRW